MIQGKSTNPNPLLLPDIEKPIEIPPPAPQIPKILHLGPNLLPSLLRILPLIIINRRQPRPDQKNLPPRQPHDRNPDDNRQNPGERD